MSGAAGHLAAEWTVAAERALIEMWYGPLSTSAIAAKLGSSKNAVIGKAHRMGLGDRIRVKSHGAMAGAAPARASRDSHAAPPTRPGGAGEPGRVFPLKALEDLGPGDCRWPEGDVGEPGFGFCGRRAKPERPYCPAHCEIAYARQQPKPDTRDPEAPRHVDRWRHW